MACSFCYSSQSRTCQQEFTFKEAKTVIDANDSAIENINWGTGENVLSPDFHRAVEYAHKKNLPQAITTNGTLFSVKHKEIFYHCIDEFDISLDFPDNRHDAVRRSPGAFQTAVTLIHELRKLGKRVTIVAVLFAQNASVDVFQDLIRLCREYDTIFRINIVFPPVTALELLPTPSKIFEILNSVFRQTSIISISDRLVASILGSGISSYIGRSLRILPNGWVTPATYLTNKDFYVRHVFENPLISDVPKTRKYLETFKTVVSPECEWCDLVGICTSGVIERRLVLCGSPLAKDPLCPLDPADPQHSDPFKGTVARQSSEKTTVHSEYLPTIIVKP